MSGTPPPKDVTGEVKLRGGGRSGAPHPPVPENPDGDTDTDAEGGGGDRDGRTLPQPAAEGDRVAEFEARPAAFDGDLAEAAVRVDGGRMAHRAQQRRVGDRIRVREAVAEVVSACLGQLAHGEHLVGAGRVELDVT